MTPAPRLLVGTLPAMLVLLGGVALKAADGDPKRTVSVNGRGSFSSAPNIAEVSLGVVTRKATAGAALSSNNEGTAAVLDLLLVKNKLARADVRTSQLSVMPEFSTPPPAPPGADPVPGVPRVMAYEVRNSVQVTVRDLDRLGPLLDAIVRAGANQLYGISFRSNAEEPSREARARAMADARSKAEQLARSEGLELGEVLSIREEGAPSYDVAPPPMSSYAMAAPAMSVPIARGEQETRATVFVVYELKKGK